VTVAAFEGKVTGTFKYRYASINDGDTF